MCAVKMLELKNANKTDDDGIDMDDDDLDEGSEEGGDEEGMESTEQLAEQEESEE